MFDGVTKHLDPDSKKPASKRKPRTRVAKVPSMPVSTPPKKGGGWGLLFRLGIGLVLLVTCGRMISSTSSTSAQPGQPNARALAKAEQATATAQALAEQVAANDPQALDHMGSANSFTEAAQTQRILIAAAIEDYQEVVNLSPNSFVAPAKTEIAKLGPTATAEVRNYFATATAVAAQATATTRAAEIARIPTPPPVSVSSGVRGSGGSSGCGSRGGPGFRKANGECASWRDVR